MRNNLVRTTLLLLLLGTMLIAFACSPGANTNQQNVQDPNVSPATIFDNDLDKPCELALTDTEREDLEGEIRGKITGKLKKNFDGPNPALTLNIIRPGTDKYYQAIISGTGFGNGQFEELANILNDFADKKKCVRKLTFRPRPTSGVTLAGGFDWSACEFPKELCSTGACGPPCVRVDDGNITVGNTNSSSNGNANANSHSNSNSNGNL